MRILFLDLDTLRPDHLGCYGYHRNTSPNIDSIAAQGTRFNNYYCSDAPCLPSRTALMTGRFGIHTGVVNHGGVCADPRPDGPDRQLHATLNTDSVASVFRNKGFKTASISPFPQRHSAWSFVAGFTETYDTLKGGNESAEEVTPTVLKWVKNNAKDDNWFLHVNYWDAHTGYRAPEEFGNPFENEPLPDWITDEILEDHKKAVGPHSALEVSMYDDKWYRWYGPRHVPAIKNREDLRSHLDGYDCGIAYMDQHIGMVFDALRKEGVFEDVVVIITADHGENQGELAIYGEHGTADHCTCNIPMIVKWPGTQAGQVDNGLHYNLDLGPTLADMIGTQRADSWDGCSYADVLRKGEDCGRDYLVVSQCAHVCQRGVRFGDYMYVRTYHDGHHLFDKEMLFNIVDDPHEQHDLAKELPEICQKAAHLYLQWHDEMMSTMSYASDPLQEVMKEGGPFHARNKLRYYEEHLRKTGREWAIPVLKERHPEEYAELPDASPF